MHTRRCFRSLCVHATSSASRRRLLHCAARSHARTPPLTAPTVTLRGSPPLVVSRRLTTTSASLRAQVFLGSSGLKVSTLMCGTMNFGGTGGSQCSEADAFAILDAYVAAGGNIIDTADSACAGWGRGAAVTASVTASGQQSEPPWVTQRLLAEAAHRLDVAAVMSLKAAPSGGLWGCHAPYRPRRLRSFFTPSGRLRACSDDAPRAHRPAVYQKGESERILGRWLAKNAAIRSKLVIASKVRGAVDPATAGPNDVGLSCVGGGAGKCGAGRGSVCCAALRVGHTALRRGSVCCACETHARPSSTVPCA